MKATCPLCGAIMRPWFTVPGDWRHPTGDRTFDVVRCPDCLFGQVYPIPSPEVLADHYQIESYYTQLGAWRRPRQSTLLERVRVRIAGYLDRGIRDRETLILRWTFLGRPSRILDIGAGGGELLCSLQARGHSVMGVEPDASAKSRQKDFPLPVYSGTAEKLPPELTDEKFDLIIMTHVMEHCSDPQRVVKNIFGLLNPGGLVLVETPNAACLDFRLGKLTWPHLGVPRHLLFWTERTLARLFTASGFSVADQGYVGLQRQFVPTWIGFGAPMRAYYRARGGFKVTPKDLGAVYYWALLPAMVCVPKRMRYDSVYLILRRGVKFPPPSSPDPATTPPWTA